MDPAKIYTAWLLTLASSVRHHDCPILALRARQTAIGLATLKAVTRTGTTVSLVQNVLIEAVLAYHHVVLQGDAGSTVERACWKQPQLKIHRCTLLRKLSQMGVEAGSSISNVSVLISFRLLGYFNNWQDSVV